MSIDRSKQQNELVHSEAPKHSEPHTGHEGTSYEGTDAKAGLVIYSLALIGGVLIFVFLLTVGIQKYVQHRNPVGELESPLAPERVLPPAPQIQVHPWEDLPQKLAHDQQVLASSGPDADGHFHVPIDSAMALVVSRLKIEPNAPVGLTTPGGTSREFSRGLTDVPPQYQGPTIRGEIEKHAQ